jgi:hypothetical protein
MNLWQQALAKANQALRCGAKTRKPEGFPCQAPAMPNRRCRMHGGKSPGAPKGCLTWTDTPRAVTPKSQKERALI